jgi:hypothetical protein
VQFKNLKIKLRSLKTKERGFFKGLSNEGAMLPI